MPSLSQENLMESSIAEFANELTESADALGGVSHDATREPRPRNPSPVSGSTGSSEGDSRRAVMRIPVTLKVVLGSASMPVASLAKLKKGSLIALDRKVGDAVDITVNGHLVARGEIVVIDEQTSRFGVSITEIGDALESRS